MSKIYFISDTHLGHTNVIDYCNRPFSTTNEMNKFIIKKWNETVNPDDIVYFLGDFALGEIDKETAYKEYLSILNGHIIFLKGNHDRSYKTLDLYFDTIRQGHILNYKEHNFILSHRPLLDAEIPDGYINIHGHIHNTEYVHLDPGITPAYHVNVSLENINYTPICVDSIVEWIDEGKIKYKTTKSIEIEKEEERMRKLATIETILDIQPIPDADSIEVATIKGWKVVVRKNEFSVGEKVIYFEIDSLIPRTSMTEFLMEDEYMVSARLRTRKLRGQVSQGLVLSLGAAYTMNEELNGPDAEPFGETEGTDLSDILHIEKYEPEVKYGNEGSSVYWPFSLSKTDEERIQNIPEVLQEIIERGIHLCASVKLDGTSMTVINQPNGVHVAGRNNDFIKEDEIAYNNKYWSTAKKYNLPEILEEYHEKFPNQYLAVQGELVGPGVQKNRMNLSELKFYIFNLFISKDGGSSWEKQGYDALIDFCDRYNLDHVPYVYSDLDLEANGLLEVDDLLEFVKGTYRNDAEGYFPNAKENQPREGLVFRTLDHSYSFKVINNDYLLKGGD